MAKAKTKKKRPSDCKNTKNGELCKGKYRLHYEDNAPTFVCNKCEHKDLTWQKFYNEYLKLFKKKENWDVEKHKVSCVIGFFCHMYKEHYGTDYIFVPQNPNPYGAKECRDTWKLLAAFKNDAHEVRKYIYWIFKKLIRSNTDIVAFGYINTPGIIRKYNLTRQKQNTITRASKLPKRFIDWCNDNVPAIFQNYELTTINDLGALLNYINFYGAEEDSIEKQAVVMAEQLELIKDNKLNIKE